MIGKWWQDLKARCATCSRVTLGLGLVFVALVVSSLLLTAGAAGLAWTNTEAFCIGCHEMRDNVYAEFKGTIHDTNRSGVRAVCADCHVPREPGPMLIRKVQATFELWGHFVTGVIDTKEKFQAHRAVMVLAHRRVTRQIRENPCAEHRTAQRRGAQLYGGSRL